MTKRMERMKLQTDLKQLQTYQSSLESFKANLENKASEVNNELENMGKYGQPVNQQVFDKMSLCPVGTG